MFEDRPLDQISDEDLHNLVVLEIREQQRLELKATLQLGVDKIVVDKNKLEMLLDVAAMANSFGGYLIYGIKENDSHGAGSYTGLDKRAATQIENTIEELATAHIRERIEGLEVRSRNINDNYIVIVKIPISSRQPHMVTFNDATIFMTRHDDHKRKMTIGEIRAAFNDDLFGRGLFRVQQELSQLQNYIKNSTPNRTTNSNDELALTEDGIQFGEARRREVWKRYE